AGVARGALSGQSALSRRTGQTQIMKIVAAANAFPAHYYSQKALGKALMSHWGKQLPDPRKLEILHSNVGVDGRFLALPVEDYPGLTFREANNAWIRVAEELGMSAVCRALAQ